MPPVGTEVTPGRRPGGVQRRRCGRHYSLSVLCVLCRVGEKGKGAFRCFSGPAQPLQFVVNLCHRQTSARASTAKADPTVPVDRAPVILCT